MTDFIVAIGLVLVIEGLLWAAFPHYALRMLEAAAEAPESNLRIAGAVAVAVGVFIVWLVRH
ncbi:MAG: DUF2065 domain-containing protein [Hyphomicrobiaceae bacterium]